MLLPLVPVVAKIGLSVSRAANSGSLNISIPSRAAAWSSGRLWSIPGLTTTEPNFPGKENPEKPEIISIPSEDANAWFSRPASESEEA